MLKIGILVLSLASAIGWFVLANSDQSHMVLKLIGAIIVSYGIFVAILVGTTAQVRSNSAEGNRARGRSTLLRH